MKRTLLWIGAVIFLLSGCLPAPTTATPLPTALPTQPPATQTPFLPATATATSIPPTATATPPVLAERVLIITVDGLRADSVEPNYMPNLFTMKQSGTYSQNAQTTFPSATLPSHSSMLTGMCPDKHGVDWNDYLPENGYAASPSIFELAHEAGLRTVMIVGKEKLRQITPPEYTDYFAFVNDRDSVIAEHAVPVIAEGFDLMFIHLPLVDILGHEYGWLSDNYLIGTFRADEAIGMILAALDEAGLRQGTLIIITADHGGKITSHGGRSAEEMTVPWILAGASLNPGAIQRPVSVVDTAATAAFALDLPLPSIWDGIPVYEAFGESAPIRVELPCQ